MIRAARALALAAVIVLVIRSAMNRRRQRRLPSVWELVHDES